MSISLNFFSQSISQVNWTKPYHTHSRNLTNKYKGETKSHTNICTPCSKKTGTPSSY